ncbi:MAG TPA: hypothetical protein VLF14_05830 [Candidatus Binatia bacterium]|nr:hypothetical protein [Candidatus Binatia bacterium]
MPDASGLTSDGAPPDMLRELLEVIVTRVMGATVRRRLTSAATALLPHDGRPVAKAVAVFLNT